MVRINDLRIGTKLYGSFSIVVFVSAMIGLFAIYQLSRINDAFVEVKDKKLPAFQALAVLRNKVNVYRMNEYQHLTIIEEKEIIALDVEIAKNEKELRQALKDYIATVTNAEERKEALLLEPLANTYFETSKLFISLSRVNRNEEALRLLKNESNKAFTNFRNHIKDLFDNNMLAATKSAETGQIIYNDSKTTLTWTILASIAISSLMVMLIVRNIVTPLKAVTGGLEKLSSGDLMVELNIESANEVGQLAASCKKLITILKSYAAFSTSIGEGKFDKSFKAQSEKDLLGVSLTAMRDKLEQVAQESEKRNWATQGVAEIGEILRTDQNNAEQLYDNIISYLIKYLGANQGALFIINREESESYLEQVACYAFSRKKFKNRRIAIGEGLVGQAVLEKEPIYLTEVPDNYVSITSGLGGSNPKSVIIMPLKLNEEIHGVIEIASFKVFEEHEVGFLSKVSESIASVISSVKTNEKTEKLLKESQEMTEAMRGQEEELRQNMEEMHATQENIHRMATDLKAQASTIDQGLASIEFTPAGHIISANSNFLSLMGYRLEEIVNKHHYIFVPDGEAETESYRNFWTELKTGKFCKNEFRRVDKKGNSIWIKGIYSPVMDENGQVTKIIKIAVDVSEYKNHIAAMGTAN